MAIVARALEIGLKEAPDQGWLSPVTLALFADASPRSLAHWRSGGRGPLSTSRLFRERYLAYGCGLSFMLGIGLYGSVYLVPVFLSLRALHGPGRDRHGGAGHGAARSSSRRRSRCCSTGCCRPRLLSVIGFALFAVGLLMSGFETRLSGYDELFWAQVVRGVALGLCIVPVTRFALGFLPLDRVSDASGLYNLSRALGGVIGIALIDTVLFSRSAEHADRHQGHDDGRSGGGRTASADHRRTNCPTPRTPWGCWASWTPCRKPAVTMAVNEAWLMMGGAHLPRPDSAVAARADSGGAGLPPGVTTAGTGKSETVDSGDNAAPPQKPIFPSYALTCQRPV